jgi:hypothetical protein
MTASMPVMTDKRMVKGGVMNDEQGGGRRNERQVAA